MAADVFATRFDRDEKQIKKDLLCLLLKDDNAPLEVAYNVNITSIQREYHPVAVFGITIEADWDATSYWEHEEEYQVAREETVYIDYKGHENKYDGVDEEIAFGGKRIKHHRRPLSRTVYDTKYRTITDDIQQTHGYVGPVKFNERVFTGSGNFGSIYLSWLDHSDTSRFIPVTQELAEKYDFSTEAISKADAEALAIQMAEKDIGKVASKDVPGTRYEGLKYYPKTLGASRITIFIGCYHIKYEYEGKKYECFISGGENKNDYIMNDYPIDVAKKTRSEELKKEIKKNGFLSSKTLFLLGAVLLSIIGVVIITLFFIALAKATRDINIAFLALWIAGIIGVLAGDYICFYKFFVMDSRQNHAISEQRKIAENTSIIKNKICEIIQSENYSEDGKKPIIDKLIKDNFGDYVRSAGVRSARQDSEVTKLKRVLIFAFGGLIAALAVAALMITILPDTIHVSSVRKELRRCEVGDIIEFGSYDKKQIEWIVLAKEDGKALVISKNGLVGSDWEHGEAGPEETFYHDSLERVTWDDSDIRELLNSTKFLNSIFRRGEKKLIAESKHVNDSNPYYGTKGGEDTIDKLFLLSASEAVKYCTSEQTIQCEALFRKSGTGFPTAWWLRTPGYTQETVTYVRNGYIDYDGVYVNSTETASGKGGGLYFARPAMWLVYDGKNSIVDIDSRAEHNDFDNNERDERESDNNNIESEGTSLTNEYGSSVSDGVTQEGITDGFTLIEFEEMSFELPKEIKFYDDGNGIGRFDYISGSGEFIFIAYDTSGNDINADNLESYYDMGIGENIQDYNPKDMQANGTILDGCQAKFVQCSLYIDNEWRPSVILAVCNEDYSRMYVISSIVYDRNAYSDEDAEMFEHILDTIKLP